MSDDIDVVVVDDQHEEAVDIDRWAGLARHCLTASAVEPPAELQLMFVSEGRMTDLNQQFMAEDGPTDVLSFPIDGADEHPAGPRLLGDIVICPTVARRYAAGHDRTVDDELALLVVHGVLHVLGMDHAEPDEEAQMQAREAELLAGWR